MVMVDRKVLPFDEFYYQLKLMYLFLLHVVSTKTVEVAFFVTGLERLQIQGVEMPTGGSTESNVRSLKHFIRFIY
jgi:hypothetical protein